MYCKYSHENMIMMLLFRQALPDLTSEDSDEAPNCKDMPHKQEFRDNTQKHLELAGHIHKKLKTQEEGGEIQRT
jgi:hypothetical protein